MSSLDGGASLDKSKPDATLSDFDRRVAAAMNNPMVMMLLLQEFKEYMVQYLALNQPPISIQQVFGFKGAVAAAKLRRDTLNAQSIPNATATAITFDTVDLDTGDFYDAAAPTRLTIPAGMKGVYEMSAQVFWAANATGYRELQVMKNGTTSMAYTQNVPTISTGNAPHQRAAMIHPLDPGDYLQVMVTQTSTVSLDVSCGDGAFYQGFTLRLVHQT